MIGLNNIVRDNYDIMTLPRLELVAMLASHSLRAIGLLSVAKLLIAMNM